MIDLYTYIRTLYIEHFSEDILNIIQKSNISLLDSNELALAIYKLQKEILNINYEVKAELKILSMLQKQFCGCEIYYSSEIGENFLLVHGIGTVIGSNVIIGKNCTIYHNVTIGTKYDTDKNKPTIGNDTIIYAGAKILGNINIGSNVVIGANSVETKDIPANEVWAGVPAKKIKDNNSNKYKLPLGVK
ncbi:serine O-acetyltransferase [Aliarcobacter lanthieri]|uniref:serine O-acetyltransferase n=1 Tax=Aliarcobacter lanthieri TaxID=1355374 RepID=UPI0004B70015|nr:serine acetyltransferase [Aliarcobacter lanthieri]